MKGYIYKITSPTNKIYIGKTLNIKNRISIYKNCHCVKQKFLYASIKKYGWKNHKFEIIFEADAIFLEYWEIYFIRQFNSFYFLNKKGMNLTVGGEGTVGHKHSPESKLKMRNKKINKKDIKAVNQFLLDGTFVKQWENRFVAERFFSKKSISIKRCLENKYLTAYGFIWSYKTKVKSVNPNFERVKNSCKQVYQYDKKYNLLNKFISTSEASKKTGVEIKNIQAVCKLKRKTAGGFFWSYKK